MKAYKINDELSNLNGRVIVPVETIKLLVATPTEPAKYLSHYDYSKILSQSHYEEVEIETEWKLKPHFSKILRKHLTFEN